MSYKWSAELYVSEYTVGSPTSPTTPTTPSFSETSGEKESPTNQATDVFHNLQVERQQFQEKLYKKWLNSKLKKATGSPQIEDLFQDLKDGRYLLLLLQVLTGKTLKPTKGNLRLHHLNNLTLALDVLREHKVKIIGINNDSITNGDKTTTLALCWNIMYHFQVVETMEHLDGNAEEALLKWCEKIVGNYSNASVKSFQPKKWRKGYTLNAIIHAFNPDLFRYSDLTKLSSKKRIEHALHHAEEAYDVHALFTAEEFHNGSVDSKALVLYVGSLYEKMKDIITPDEVVEVEAGNTQEQETTEEMAKRLEAAENQLIALNEKPVPELFVIPENRAVMETQYQDVMKELETIEGKLVIIMQDVDQESNISEDNRNKFQDQISAMAQFHADIKDKWETCKDSFFVKLDQQHAKEMLLSSKWNQKIKSMDDTLTAFEGKISVLSSEPVNAENAENSFASYQALINELESSDVSLQADLEFGKTLVRSNKILDKKLKELIMKDVKEITERREKLHLILRDGKQKANQEIDRLKDIKNQENKDLNEWLKNITLARKKLQDFEIAGQNRSSNPGTDLPSAIEEQIKLVEEAVQYKNDIDGIVSSGDTLAMSFSSEEKKNEVKQETESINQLSIATLTFLEKILKRLQEDYNTQIKKELLLLKKWKERAEMIDGWLNNMESYLNNMNANDDQGELVSLKSEFDSYHEKLKHEGPNMLKNIEFGNTLLKSGKIKVADNQEQLQSEINDLSLRKDQLDLQFSSGSARLVAAEEQYSLNQTKLLNLWFTKASEIKKQLRGIELKGQLSNAQTKDELIEVVEKLSELSKGVEGMRPVVDAHIDEGNGLMNMTNSANKTEEIDQEIKALKGFFDSVGEALETNNMRFQNRLNRLVGDEEQLVLQWKEKQKQIHENLCEVEEQIEQFSTELPEDIALLEAAIEEHHVFTSSVANREGEMEISIGFGNSLLNNDRITETNTKESLQEDLKDISQRKVSIHAKLEDRKENILSALLYQKKRKTSVTNAWIERALFFRKELREIEQKGQFVLNGGTKDEIIDIMRQLQELLESVNDLQPSIDNHLENGDGLVRTSTGSKADDINQEINTLKTSVNMVRESLESSLTRFQKRISELQGEEEQLVLQWKEKQKQIHENLCEVEEQIEQFSAELPEDIALLEAAIEEDEIFTTKFGNKEVEIEIPVGFGKTLLNTDRIVEPAHKESLSEDLNAISKRKELIQAKIRDRKASLLATLDALKKKETSELNAWYTKTNDYNTFLRKIKSEGRTVIVKNEADAKNAIVRQETLIKQTEENQKPIFGHSASGGKLLKTLSNQTKIENLKEEVKALLVNYKITLDSLKTTLASYKESLAEMSVEKSENSSHLLTRLQLFHDWIKFAKQQLEFVSTSQNQEFHDLILKEQGLKKLSADMESRSEECGQFMKMLEGLSENKNSLSQKDLEVKNKIEELQSEWNIVIDAVDQEFKQLYDTINSLVDERRGMLEKALSSLKHQLIALEQNEESSNEAMLEKAKSLAKINEELGKVKPQIVKLSQHTGALNEVTLFMDNEKEVMKQSSESLQLQYVGCRDQSTQLRRSFQEDIMNQVNTHCAVSSEKVQEIEKQSVSFESINLSSMQDAKEFLLHEQKLIEEVKVEHFKLDDIENFTEQIASHNILSPEDQVSLANTINSALKVVEDAQKKSKTKINKVYAVCYHTLKQNYQILMNRLKDIDRESSELDDSVLQDFIHLKNDLSSLWAILEELKNVSEDEQKVQTDIESINEILEPSDLKKLSSLEESYKVSYDECDGKLAKAKQRLVAKAEVISARKLDEFMGWYPIMQRRSNEGSDVGPDAIAIERQLQEVKVIEQQANYHSFSLLVDDEHGQALTKEMEPGLQKEIEDAHAQWVPIKEWLNTRKNELENARRAWDEFTNNCSDLVEYLNHTEKEIFVWKELDLNDDESVEEQKLLLKDLLLSMETRKPHMIRLNEVLGNLLDLIGVEGQVSSRLRSQVTDIAALWNKLIKSNIENSTKLERVHKKFKDLDLAIFELRDWIANAVEILRILSTEDKYIEDSLKQVELKRLESLDSEIKLDYIITTSEELSSDADTVGHFTINEDIQLLERDFQGVKIELDRLDTMLSKAFLLVRRLRYSIRTKIDNFNQPSDKSIASKESEVNTSKMDVQLQDVSEEEISKNTTETNHQQPQEVPVN